MGFICVVSIVNIYLLISEVVDQSWGSIFIACVASPVLNSLVAITSLTYAAIARRVLRGSLRKTHTLVSILLPSGFALCNFFILFLLDLHGC